MRKNKISELEFAKRVINKELEIVNGPTFDNIDDLSNWTKENPDWFSDYSFKTREQFIEWKKFFDTEFYNCFPRSTSKAWRERYFDEFNLSYGLKCSFKSLNHGN